MQGELGLDGLDVGLSICHVCGVGSPTPICESCARCGKNVAYMKRKEQLMKMLDKRLADEEGKGERMYWRRSKK